MNIQLPKKRKRPDLIADAIRERIVLAGLQPGARIPADWISEDKLHVSRGTLREALKILEVQGLIVTRTGPGGGTFVSAIDPSQALLLLDNLFLFEPPSIANIYAIRKALEPEVAAGLAGKLSDTQLDALKQTIRLYENEPTNVEEEYRMRLSELDFHTVLASFSDNKLLGFVCTFMISLLRDMTECRAIYAERNPGLRETGLNYQVALVRALKAGDAERTRMVMAAHMLEAEVYMLERAALRRRGPSS